MEKYEIREMKAPDVFKLTSILSKIGIKEFVKLFNKENLSAMKDKKITKEEKEAMALELGIGVIGVLLENIERCEQPIYKFIAGLCNVEKDEIEDMKGADFFNLLTEIFTRKDFLDFFKVALRFQK